MNMIMLTQKSDGQTLHLNTDQVCYLVRNGDGAIVTMANRAEVRVTESVDEIRDLLGLTPPVASGKKHPAETRETKN